MPTKKIIFVIVIVLIFFFAMPAIKTFFQSEEERIRNVIFQAKRAAEKEKLLKCISYVSLEYYDSYGNDRQNLMLIAKELFDTYDKLVITLREIDINVEDDLAKAEISVVVFGIRKGTERKEKIIEQDSGKFKVFFKKIEGDWKVIKMELLEKETYISIRA